MHPAIKIMIRREHVRRFLTRAMPIAAMASVLGVSRYTIANDIRWLRDNG